MQAKIRGHHHEGVPRLFTRIKISAYLSFTHPFLASSKIAST